MILLLKNLIFTVVVPATVAVYVPLLVARGRSPAVGWPLGIGVALVLSGASMYAWCVRDFAMFGRGTPFPLDAPKKLVIRGLYRYTRNPMYVAVLTVVSGWAIVFRSWALVVYGCGVWACFHLVVVGYEERRLRREFGQEYDDYRARVGRWLPRPPRRTS